MTDEEIKKALECCDDFGWCGQCSLQGVIDCKTVLTDNALDLINRQQKQLDNYSHNVRNMSKDFIEQQKIIYRQQAQLEYLQGEREVLLEDIKASSNQVIEQQTEIEKLERVISYLEGVCESTPDKVRVEAIKEFAERLKYKFKGDNLCDFLFVRMAINNLVKEMVGEGK